MKKTVLEASYELKIQSLESQNKAFQTLIDAQKNLISQLKNQIGFYKIEYDTLKSQLDQSIETSNKAMDQIKERDKLINVLNNSLKLAEKELKKWDETINNLKPYNRLN
ncbi:MAG: hypothetical protein ACOCVF_02475 [bacterium]